MSRLRKLLGKMNQQSDKGLMHLCHAVSKSRDSLGSEATAGIEPAIEGFADFSLDFSIDS
jgi:hypothetical protein